MHEFQSKWFPLSLITYVLDLLPWPESESERATHTDTQQSEAERNGKGGEEGGKAGQCKTEGGEKEGETQSEPKKEKQAHTETEKQAHTEGTDTQLKQEHAETEKQAHPETEKQGGFLSSLPRLQAHAHSYPEASEKRKKQVEKLQEDLELNHLLQDEQAEKKYYALHKVLQREKEKRARS